MSQLKFSGHQTFALRYGWLQKGFYHSKSGASFSSPDAIIRLGVGKNMVNSIEYWCKLSRLLDETGRPTVLAQKLLDEKTGWDPYLESDASWWLLHWNIVGNPLVTTSASALFSFLRKTEFSKVELRELIIRKFLSATGKKVSSAILDRDIDCFVRSYYARPTKKDSADGAFECPFQELHLIEPLSSDAGSYRFNIGPKHTLPPHIIGYALWDMLSNRGIDSLRLQEALYGEYSPGQVFMIDENFLVDAILYLHEDPRFGSYFALSESAGIDTRVLCSLQDGLELLEALYTEGCPSCKH